MKIKQLLDSFKKTYAEMSLPVKATFWFTISNIILKGISVITAPISFRLLPEDEYGKYAVFISYQQLFLILATWEMYLGAHQKGIFKYKDNIREYTAATQLLINLLTIIVFVVTFIFIKPISQRTGFSNYSIIFIFLFLFFYPSYNMWINIKRKNYDYISVVLITLFYGIMNALLPVLAIIYINKTADVRFTTSMIISAIICVYFYIKNFRNIDFNTLRSSIKEYWNYSIRYEAPLLLHSLSFFLLGQVNQILIGNLESNSYAAYYSVATSMASVLTVISTSINTTLKPYRFETLENKNYEKLRKNTTVVLVLFALMSVCFVLISPEAITILFNERASHSLQIVSPLAACVFFQFMYTVFVNVEEYYEKTKYVVYVSLTCGIINVLLNYFAIKQFGYLSSAYVSLFCYILFCLGHYYFMNKTLEQQNIQEKVVDTKKILLISFVLVVSCSISNLLIENFVLRYILLLIILIIMYIKRKDIIKHIFKGE